MIVFWNNMRVLNEIFSCIVFVMGCDLVTCENNNGRYVPSDEKMKMLYCYIVDIRILYQTHGCYVFEAGFSVLEIWQI